MIFLGPQGRARPSPQEGALLGFNFSQTSNALSGTSASHLFRSAPLGSVAALL